MFPGVEPDDVEELASSMERTAHLYRGFGREREAHRAVRVLHRTGRNRPRVWTMSTLECRTLGRSTWFRLEDGTAVRVDDPIALVSGDELPMGDVPENVLQFRDAGLHLELRGTGAAIL